MTEEEGQAGERRAELKGEGNAWRERGSVTHKLNDTKRGPVFSVPPLKNGGDTTKLIGLYKGYISQLVTGMWIVVNPG